MNQLSNEVLQLGLAFILLGEQQTPLVEVELVDDLVEEKRVGFHDLVGLLGESVEELLAYENELIVALNVLQEEDVDLKHHFLLGSFEFEEVQKQEVLEVLLGETVHFELDREVAEKMAQVEVVLYLLTQLGLSFLNQALFLAAQRKGNGKEGLYFCERSLDFLHQICEFDEDLSIAGHNELLSSHQQIQLVEVAELKVCLLDFFLSNKDSFVELADGKVVRESPVNVSSFAVFLVFYCLSGIQVKGNFGKLKLVKIPRRLVIHHVSDGLLYAFVKLLQIFVQCQIVVQIGYLDQILQPELVQSNLGIKQGLDKCLDKGENAFGKLLQQQLALELSGRKAFVDLNEQKSQFLELEFVQKD